MSQYSLKVAGLYYALSIFWTSSVLYVDLMYLSLTLSDSLELVKHHTKFEVFQKFVVSSVRMPCDSLILSNIYAFVCS